MNDLPDSFYWYCRMDMATTVAALSRGLITPQQAGDIAQGIQAVIRWGEEHADQRPTDYLDIQSMLFERVGPDASRMHVGRSRQDMLATLHRLLLRDRLLLVMEGLLDIRESFLQKGCEFETLVVPTYTNGVQAQPASFGHLMCGYEAPLARSAQRSGDAYNRLNQSPLGAAALATTRFDVDRQYIAKLLGFDGIVENAFDAAQLGIVDAGVECAQLAALIALNLNMFIQNLHAQFHHARPWIALLDPSLSSPSTLMPQKRNPVVLNRTRLLGSEVVGASVSAALAAHNLCSGLTDYKRTDCANTLDLTLQYFEQLNSVVNAMQVDSDAAFDELAADYSTTSELAAILQEELGIPIAITHAFCSRLVDTARARRLPLHAIPHADLCAVFREVLSEKGIDPAPAFPFDVDGYQRAVHPMTMVNNYRGQGGSSPPEVRRMLESAQMRLHADKEWLAERRTALRESEQILDQHYVALCGCS